LRKENYESREGKKARGKVRKAERSTLRLLFPRRKKPRRPGEEDTVFPGKRSKKSLKTRCTFMSFSR